MTMDEKQQPGSRAPSGARQAVRGAFSVATSLAAALGLWSRPSPPRPTPDARAPRRAPEYAGYD